MFGSTLGEYMAVILVVAVWILIIYGVMHRFKRLVKDAVKEAVKEASSEKREESR